MATKFSTDVEHGPSADADFAAWAFYQAMLMRSGQLHLLDRHAVAEELDTLGQKEFRTLDSLLARIIQHMLKWDHQPERRGVSWTNSIAGHRSQVQKLLSDSPSLKSRQLEGMVEAYPDAVRYASTETGLLPRAFPNECPYTWDDIMSRPFDWPEEQQ